MTSPAPKTITALISCNSWYNVGREAFGELRSTGADVGFERDQVSGTVAQFRDAARRIGAVREALRGAEKRSATVLLQNIRGAANASDLDDAKVAAFARVAGLDISDSERRSLLRDIRKAGSAIEANAVAFVMTPQIVASEAMTKMPFGMLRTVVALAIDSAKSAEDFAAVVAVADAETARSRANL